MVYVIGKKQGSVKNMKINLQLNLKRPHEKYLHVTLNMSLSQDESLKSGGELVLNFPVWTPGSYLVREHASQVNSFLARTAGGKILPFEKIHKSRWKIHIGQQRKISVTYRIYANLLNVRGVYADHQVVFVNSCGVFFHPDGYLHESVTLSITAERGWPVFLQKQPHKKSYTFANFDELYDTPILAAKHADLKSFRVGKTRFRLVCQGYSAIDLQKVVNELKKIIAKQVSVFGDHPCRDYLFQVIFGPNFYGGLEHRASSTNVFDGGSLIKPDQFKDFLSLLAHEHFHLWNVKRIRPRALGPFDYLQEAYTRELWMAEGITRYYDDHSLVRTGLFSPQEYLNQISESINKEDRQKAYRVDSLSASSFDAWIRYYRPDENQENSLANYYLRGGLVMMLLDLQLLAKSQGRFSLDSVMRDLYHLYKKRPELGVTRDEFFAAAQKYGLRSSTDFIKKYIDGTDRLPLAEAFRPFGIAVVKEKSTVLLRHDWGATCKMQDKAVVIAKIHEDSPAFHSELQPADEILAINGHRVDSLDGLNHLLDEPRPKVLFCRRGQVYETSVQMVAADPFVIKLKIRPHLTQMQKRMLSRFLRKNYE